MDTRKTVLIVTPGGRARTGGIAKIVDHTVRNWPADSPFRLKVVDSYGTGGVIWMPFYFAGAIAAVLYALLFDNLHVLHVNMTERLSVWRKLSITLLGLAFGVPVVIHMHGASFAEYYEKLPGWRQYIVRSIMRSCGAVLVLGAYWMDYVATKLTIPHSKVRILYNAVPTIDVWEKKPADKCRLLFLGIVGERKGVDTLLNALAHQQMAGLDWEAVIGGNGEVSRFETMSASLGLTGRVKFTGLLDETGVKDQLSRTDVFVLPSRNEGFPVAILEAMSYGCAIVSTPVGSIGDAIIPEETGLLIAPGDHEGLAEALSRLVEGEALRHRLGAAAKSKFQACYTLPNYVAELESVYENVTVQLAPPPGVRAIKHKQV